MLKAILLLQIALVGLLLLIGYGLGRATVETKMIADEAAQFAYEAREEIKEAKQQVQKVETIAVQALKQSTDASDSAYACESMLRDII